MVIWKVQKNTTILSHLQKFWFSSELILYLYTQNKNLVEVGQMGIKSGSWLVNLLVTLGY